MSSPPWRASAPEAFARFDRIEALVAGSADPALLGPVRRAVAATLDHPAELARTPAPATPADPRADTCVRFAEQFVVDVAGIDEALRGELTETLGADAFAFVQALFVVDCFQRARITLERVFGVPYPAPPPPETGDLWAALEDFMRVVARSQALDPLTAELVRLRGARTHQCRVCQSRLSVKALDLAGDPSTFDVVDDYEHSDLDERHKLALRLADAQLTLPTLLDPALGRAVLSGLGVAATTEIVLDVARNSTNKIAVALGGDAAVVEDGVEFYDIDAGGDVFASVDLAAVRAATI